VVGIKSHLHVKYAGGFKNYLGAAWPPIWWIYRVFNRCPSSGFQSTARAQRDRSGQSECPPAVNFKHITINCRNCRNRRLSCLRVSW